MTVGDWLAQRTPALPDALRERILDRLGDDVRAPAERAAAICAAAGVRVVDSLTSTDCSARQHAIDLLAADALVTYAIESATEHSTDFAGEMDALVARVAAVAGSTT